MRQIGNLPNRVLASRFAAYLITENVSCEADEEDDGQWSIWVHDEQRIDEAKRELEAFRQAPESEKYQGREAVAERKIRDEQKRRQESQRNTVDVRTTRRFGQPTPPAPFVMTLIALSVIITLFTNFGKGGDPGSLKAGVATHMEFVTRAAYRAQGDPLANIKKGEVWRFVTPIFPHLDFFHLLFNMFWLYQLGRALEWRMGAPRLALFVLVVAAISNSAQAMTPQSMWEVMGGPFGFGMSGVVYGLFGYTWMKGQADPASGLTLPPTLIFLMIGWLFLCMTPLQDAANSAHVGGLIAGMLIAQIK